MYQAINGKPVNRLHFTYSVSNPAQYDANTYDWIIATAASKINRRICAVINTVNNVCLIDGPLFPSKVNIKCPRIIRCITYYSFNRCSH